MSAGYDDMEELGKNFPLNGLLGSILIISDETISEFVNVAAYAPK